MPPQTPKSTTTVYLDQPPSCLQTCPKSPNHLIIGTYLLTETKDEEGTIQQTKTGSLQLWHLTPETNSLSQIQKIPLPYAVFDLHFHPTDPTCLAVATSTASVALFRLSAGPTPELHPVWTKSVHEDPSIPALFLAWMPTRFLDCGQADGFAVTFSDGRTAVWGCSRGMSDPEQITEVGSFAAREMIEVWFVALGVFSDDGSSREIPFMFTGNDFGALHTRRFEREPDEGEGALLSGLALDYDDRARHHTAGVTAILPLSLPLVDGAPVVLTGSYDESLRVYHATRRGEVLAEAGLGGGVWRLQLVRTERCDVTEGGEEWKFLVLASCMHAGTRVVRVTRMRDGEGSRWEIEVLAEFTEHESMNYASDVWKPEGGYDLQGKDTSELLCVSSSFYDRRLCLWRVHI
ncbi:hypothetical protein BDV28DRAFT_150670 [Aspergillus coremiiformis]|uniref:WD40-repeat-containing domain protein n=1 Tax=Aspergillus coremiiformis TaxID=138285 RepID=A0A5N6Z0N2_9EURO|nr:hypothetical protein BDV28DRAFT_150670 [Aspergillus coremiiformis]